MVNCSKTGLLNLTNTIYLIGNDRECNLASNYAANHTANITQNISNYSCHKPSTFNRDIKQFKVIIITHQLP